MPLPAGLRPAALWLAGLASISLFALASLRIYDFSDPQAWYTIHADSEHYLDLVTRLPRGSALVLALAVFLGAAAGLGRWAIRALCPGAMDFGEAALLTVAVGLGLLTYIFLGLGWLQLLRPPVIAVVVAIGLAGLAPAAIPWARRLPSLPTVRPRTGSVVLVAGLVAALYLSLLSALGPEVQFDARWYHLGVPVHYALHGGFYDIVRETHLTVAALTPYQEVLYSGLVSLLGPIGAKLLHWADMALAALALVLIARAHLGSARAGLLAAILFVTTPEVAWSAGTASNDLPMPLLALLVVHCVLRWRKEPGRPGWLFVAGVLGGYSIGVKPFGLFTLGMAGLLVLGQTLLRSDIRYRSAALALAGMGGLALLACLPWMAHAYHLTGDPVFPAFYRVFHTPYWNAFTDQVARAIPQYYGAEWSWRGLVTLPWQLTVRGDHYRTLIGPLFLASAPLVLLALAQATGPEAVTYRLLTLFTVLWTLAWFASGLLVLRYAETVVAGLALLVATPILGGRGLRVGPPTLQWGWLAATAFAVLLNSQLLVVFQRHSQEQLVEARAAFAWRYLYDGQSERDYLSGVPPIIWYLDDHLPAAGTKVFDDCALIPYYADTTVELYNGWNYDGPAHVEGWSIESPDAYQHLSDAHVTHVVICASDEAKAREWQVWQHLVPVPVPNGRDALLYRLG